MPDASPDPRLTAGVAALKAGDHTTGAYELRSLLTDDPTNGYAWLWYSTVVVSPSEKRYCLERVLEFGPGSAKVAAKNGLKQLPAGPPINPLPPLVPLPTVAEIATPPPAPAKPQSKNMTCGTGLVLLLLIGFGCAGVLMLLGRPVSGVPSAPTNFNAYYMCKEFMQQRLKAPSTATFDSFGANTTDISQIDAQTFQVDSFVEAQNSFGAPLRVAYVCRVRSVDGTNWTLEKLTTSDDL